MLYLWLKTLHIVFVSSWFAGLAYLPRLFINSAMETNAPTLARLNLMARKLYRFTTIVAVISVILGIALWQGIGIGKGPGNGWMHAKLFLVILMIGYHHACGAMLKKFEAGQNRRSHVWFRYFNEITVVLFLGIVALVVIKPF